MVILFSQIVAAGMKALVNLPLDQADFMEPKGSNNAKIRRFRNEFDTCSLVDRVPL